MSTGGNRAAIYTRISEDPKTRAVRGQAVNTATQEKDARALAADRGLDVVAVFTDNDITAADPAVVRPGFEALLERVLAGDFDVVIVYAQDRFVRLAADLERVIAIFSVSGTALLPVVGTTDFESPEGKLYARFNTLLGSYEVEKVKLRVRRKMQDNADKGLPFGGAAGYGFNPDKMTVNEDEATRIKEAAERVIAGDALNAIVRDWTEVGYAFRGGRPWRPSALRRILIAPRTAGLRQHQGEIIGKAAWPAILDRETYDRVCRILTNPARNKATTRDQKLLTAIIRCGKCGKGLNAKRDKNKGPRYFCRHCHGTLVAADHVDEIVVSDLLEAIDSAALADAIRRQQKQDGSAADVNTLARLEADLVDLANELGAGSLTMAEWKAARAGIEKRMADLRRNIERQAADSTLADLAGKGADLRNAWEDFSHGKKRKTINAVFESITIAPARQGFNRFDPERVVYRWNF